MKTRRAALFAVPAALALLASAARAQPVAANPPTVVSSAPSGSCVINEPMRIVDRGPKVGRAYTCPYGAWEEASPFESAFAAALADPSVPFPHAYFNGLWGPTPEGFVQPYSYHLQLGAYTDSGARPIVDIYSRGNLEGPYTDHVDLTGVVTVDETTLRIDGDGDSNAAVLNEAAGILGIDADEDGTIEAAFGGNDGVNINGLTVAVGANPNTVLDSSLGDAILVTSSFSVDKGADDTEELSVGAGGVTITDLMVEPGPFQVDLVPGGGVDVEVFLDDLDQDGTDDDPHFGFSGTISAQTLASGSLSDDLGVAAQRHLRLTADSDADGTGAIQVDSDGDGTVEASFDSSGRLSTAASTGDAHTGALYYSDATNNTHDTGTLVCTALGKTCVTTYLPDGTNANCANDYATPFFAVCR